ncbi:MAG: hypothetical protein A2086_07205 [Spirochaetes bacterium GWD1_27_9]|nr:MAG: hypothetical protein A2Z98_11650 [Spirochaetes bacterium GWB1_27_13]OHD25696.1 MAG: hypothetical protein A2Y34_14360 [Spirochaetes bacterium GWC1_27_15]OHD32189.1 MAG: hypothetical protein A2086_07205 [Spirochaetes bacterium GWD1_27_9]
MVLLVLSLLVVIFSCNQSFITSSKIYLRAEDDSFKNTSYTYNLGNVYIGEEVKFDIYLYNAGEGSFDINETNFKYTGSADFTFIFQSKIVNPDENFSFTVVFKPTGEGEIKGNINLNNAGTPTTNIFSTDGFINLVGVGTKPKFPTSAKLLTIDKWQDESMDVNETEKWYYFIGSKDTNYYIYSDSKNNGSNTKSLDVKVSAYKNDTTSYFVDELPSYYGKNIDVTSDKKLVSIRVCKNTNFLNGTYSIMCSTNSNKFYSPIISGRYDLTLISKNQIITLRDFYNYQLPQEFTFYLNNTGNGYLNLIGRPLIQINNDINNEFEILENPDRVIKNNQSSEFKLKLSYFSKGEKNINIIIPNDDLKNKDFNFNVKVTFNFRLVFNGNSKGYPQDDEAKAIAIDNNNNVYIVGYGSNLIYDTTKHDWWIKKFDSNGKEDLNWNKKFDGNNNYDNDEVNAIAIDSNNNVYVGGYCSNYKYWWIKKFDSNGNEIWDKGFDGNNGWDSIVIDSNNNIYVAGYGSTLISSSSSYDWWIKKFDSNGNEIWDRRFDGNNGWDKTTSIAIDTNNNVYVTGYGYNLVSSSSNNDWWIKKFDSNGNEIWDKRFDGNNGWDEATSIAIDTNNNVYVVGFGYNLVSSSSSYDWWIKKFDSNGKEDLNWDKKINNIYGDSLTSITVDNSNNICTRL